MFNNVLTFDTSITTDTNINNTKVSYTMDNTAATGISINYSTVSKNIGWHLGVSNTIYADIYVYSTQESAIYSKGWADGKYRVITFTTPLKYSDSPEFYEWFVNNAVLATKIILAGTYLFKGNNDIDTHGYNGKDVEGVMAFKSNNASYTRMLLLYVPNSLAYSTQSTATSACASSLWQDQNYRAIIVETDQPVIEDFYN